MSPSDDTEPLGSDESASHGTDDGQQTATDGGQTTPTEGSGPTGEHSQPTFGRGPDVPRRLLRALSEIRLTAAVSGLATLLAALLVGSQLLGIPLTGLALGAGATLALGLYALNSDRPWVLLSSGFILTVASTLLAATLGVAVSFAFRTAVAVGHLAEATVIMLVVGGFAAVLTIVPFDEEEVLAGSFMRFIGMLIPLTAVQLLVAAAVTWQSTILFLARLIVDSPEPLLGVARTLLAPSGGGALLTLLLYPVVVLFLLNRVFVSLPLVRLFPPRQRSSISDRIDDVTGLLRRTVFVTGVGAVGILLGAAVLGVASPSAIANRIESPLAGIVVGLLTSVWIRVLFVLVGGVLIAVLVAEQVRRRARRRSEADLLRYLLPPAGAIIVAIIVGGVFDLLVSRAMLLSQAPPGVRSTAESVLANGVFPAALLVVFGSLIVVGILFIALTLLAGSPVLPERALGPALASTALFAMALVLALFRGSPLLAFGTAALALVAWDTGEFATGLREELPQDATTLRGEFVHVGGTLTVGLLAVLGAFIVTVLISGDVVVPDVAETALAAGALTLAFGAIILLVSSLRE